MPSTPTGTTVVSPSAAATTPLTAQQKQGQLQCQTRPTISQHLQELHERGYTIISSLFSRAQVASLRKCATQAISLARSNQWPFLRTLPKQFPPWSSPYDPEVGIWGVQHLLHPSMPLDARRQFASVYFDDGLLSIIRGLLSVPPPSSDTHNDAGAGANKKQTVENEDQAEDGAEEELILELFNMLITPDFDFALRWHRDDVSFNLSQTDEASALGLSLSDSAASGWIRLVKGDRSGNGQGQGHVQYNIPLYHDSSLHIVPGSHLRPRTDHERDLLDQHPYSDDLPGMLEVALNPGDVVFYDNNIIHRGVYMAASQRATLHGSVGDRRREGGRGRARNVLQHGIGDWVTDSSLKDLLDSERARRTAESMRRNLIQIGRTVEGDVGFSHAD